MSTPQQPQQSDPTEAVAADLSLANDVVAVDPTTDPTAPPRKPGTVSPNEVRTQP
ncbi:hypothetical protein [Streptacidiphilus anmyonensis]|uniref:hypothetical protein n=1 Tax=Streptacidiphilus anmyonensis TaxID=405782 RepID=UPI000A749316|nr:hypothetical protein [Streptacidiphilus anmyonensis]